MNIPKFEDLKTSTRTLMVYTNIQFDHEKIFREIKWTEIDVPLTKKKKNVDKKRLSAPYGSIISVRYGDKLRGINLRKGKQRRCGVCQFVKNSSRKICTVSEKLIRESKLSDVWLFRYFCSKCKRLFTGKELYNPLTHFLNQVTIVLATENLILNIMLFKNCFKIAGCREDDDAVEAAMILWENYIRPLKAFSLPAGEEPNFLFHLVMRNVDFRLGFPVDRQKLNQLMNEEKYKDKVCMSQCETTSHTNVNIKMYTKKPPGHIYKRLVIPNDTSFKPYWDDTPTNPYKEKKNKKKKNITFIVFSSSEVILSGRYEENMKKMYQFFVEETYKNREKIQERIETPKVDLLTYLKNNNLSKE